MAKLNDTKIFAVNISRTYATLKARREARVELTDANRGPDDREDEYDCTRHYWKAKLERAQQAELVFGVAHGEVVAVFEPEEWHYTSNPDYRGRISFTGKEITDSPFIGMNLTDYFKNPRQAIRYIGHWE